MIETRDGDRHTGLVGPTDRGREKEQMSSAVISGARTNAAWTESFQARPLRVVTLRNDPRSPEIMNESFGRRTRCGLAYAHLKPLAHCTELTVSRRGAAKRSASGRHARGEPQPGWARVHLRVHLCPVRPAVVRPDGFCTILKEYICEDSRQRIKRVSDQGSGFFFLLSPDCSKYTLAIIAVTTALLGGSFPCILY